MDPPQEQGPTRLRPRHGARFLGQDRSGDHRRPRGPAIRQHEQGHPLRRGHPQLPHAAPRGKPPANSSAAAFTLSDADEIRECVKWALESRFAPEQTRYYRVKGNTISWWMLVTTPCLEHPLKVRVESV